MKFLEQIFISQHPVVIMEMTVNIYIGFHNYLQQLDIPMVATNDVHYHEPARRQLQDIVTCIREKCTIYNAGFRLHPNAERYLKPIDEMLRLVQAIS